MDRNDNNTYHSEANKVEEGLTTGVIECTFSTLNNYDGKQEIDGTIQDSPKIVGNVGGATARNEQISEDSLNSMDETNQENNDDSFSKEDWISRRTSTEHEGNSLSSHHENSQAMTTLAAKREYNRRNAARARQRAKTQLYEYQKQIQELDVEISTLREVNTSLKASLHSLQQENVRLIQNLDDMNHEGVSNRQDPIASPVAYNSAATHHQQQLPSFLEQGRDISSTPVLAAPANSLNQALMQIYLAGVAVQQQNQSSMISQQNLIPVPTQQLNEQSFNTWTLTQPTMTITSSNQQQQATISPVLPFAANNFDATQIQQQLMNTLLSLQATNSTHGNGNVNADVSGSTTSTNNQYTQ